MVRKHTMFSIFCTFCYQKHGWVSCCSFRLPSYDNFVHQNLQLILGFKFDKKKHTWAISHAAATLLYVSGDRHLLLAFHITFYTLSTKQLIYLQHFNKMRRVVSSETLSPISRNTRGMHLPGLYTIYFRLCGRIEFKITASIFTQRQHYIMAIHKM